MKKGICLYVLALIIMVVLVTGCGSKGEDSGVWVPVSIIAYNQQGEELSGRYYERDQNGNILKYKITASGDPVAEEQFFYDSQGIMLKSVTTRNTLATYESEEEKDIPEEKKYEVAVDALSGKITEISTNTVHDTVSRVKYIYRNDGSMQSEQFRITTANDAEMHEMLASTNYYPTGLEASFSFVLNNEADGNKNSYLDVVYTYLWKYDWHSRPKKVIMTRVRGDETDTVHMKLETDKYGNITRVYAFNPEDKLTVSEVKITYKKITHPSASAMIFIPTLGNILRLEPGMLS